MERTDLSYSGVEYDYERSGCICHDWPCRCTTIQNTWIESININKVMTEFLHNNFIKINNLTEIDLYCFDRRLRSLIFNAIEKQKQQYAQKSYRYMLKVQVIAIGMRMKVYIASVMMI